MKTLFLWIIMITLAPLSGVAQTYILTGKIIDDNSGETLPGATIVIKETGAGTATDADGRFELSSINRPQITLEVAFLGYEDLIFEHKFKKETEDIFIRLKPASTMLGEVNVKGESEGTVKAFVLQKESESLKNIVSSEQIEQFPDMNAAEAMQRIPGITLRRDQGEGRFIQLRGTPPQYTTFNVNGVQLPSAEGSVRYVGMDIISASMIDFFEVTKMLTPDMDGDAIAGTVNIITKKAKSEKADIDATIASGYSNLRAKPNYQLLFQYGQRYKKFGFFINASYFQNEFGSDNFEFQYVKGPFWGGQNDSVDNYNIQYREFQLRHYNIVRKRTSASATIDYQFNENSSIYLKGMINRFTDDEIRRRKVYQLDDAISLEYYLYGGVEHDIRDRTKIQNLNTVSFGGQHQLNKFELIYDVSYAIASEDNPRMIFGRYDNPGQAIRIRFDMSEPEYPRPFFPEPEEELVATNYAAYQLDRFSITDGKLSDANLSPKIDLKYNYWNEPHSSGFIKIGARFRYKRKIKDVTSRVYGKYDTVSSLYPGTGDPNDLPLMTDGFYEDNLLNQGYELEYIPYSVNLYDHYELNPWFYILNQRETRNETVLEDYTAQENIQAFYFMIQHQIRKLMILAGVRYEATQLKYTGSEVVYDGPFYVGVISVDDNRNVNFLLPSIQLRYRYNDRTNIRAGVTTSYTRPSFKQMIPTRSGFVDDDIHLGNFNIDFPLALNFDLAVEKYIQGNGILSVALYYKYIENYISTFSKYFLQPNGRNVYLETYINGDYANVYGVELQSQFKFSFLPGILKDFGLFGNYAFTHSEAVLPRRPPANYTTDTIYYSIPIEEQIQTEGQEILTLPGQAKHALNLALFYETKRTYLKLSLNYHDTYLYELGADEDFDVFYRFATHIDFNSYYNISEHAQVFLDLVNITDQPLIYHFRDPYYVSKKEFYSWSARFGIKLVF